MEQRFYASFSQIDRCRPDLSRSGRYQRNAFETPASASTIGGEDSGQKDRAAPPNFPAVLSRISVPLGLVVLAFVLLCRSTSRGTKYAVELGTAGEE